jgi:hypothetical protein
VTAKEWFQDTMIIQVVMIPIGLVLWLGAVWLPEGWNMIVGMVGGMIFALGVSPWLIFALDKWVWRNE